MALLLLLLLCAVVNGREILLNREDEHACIHTVKENYPDCFSLVRPNKPLTAVRIEFDGWIHDDWLKNIIATAINNECTDCPNVTTRNIVTLSADRGYSDFVVAHDGMHQQQQQLHNKYVIDSKKIIRILVQANLDGMHVRSILPIDMSYTTEKPQLPATNSTDHTMGYIAGGLGLVSLASSIGLAYKSYK